MQKHKQTSTSVASLAARILGNPTSSQWTRTLAGFAGAQTALSRKRKRSCQEA